MQPFDYRLQVQDPFKSALGAVQLGESLASIQAKRQQAALDQQAMQQALERKNKFDTHLTKMFQSGIGNATAEDFALATTLTDKDTAKTLQDNFAMLNKDQREQTVQRGAQLLAALKNNKPELAEKMLTEREVALTNAGDEKSLQEAASIREQIKLLKTNPEIVKYQYGYTLAALPEGKQALESILKLEPKDDFRPPTAEERRKFQLPADGVFQVGPDKKVYQVTSGGPLVKITGPLTGADSKYADEVGKASAEEDVGAVKAAIKGAGDLTKINRTLKELYSSQAITGFGADTFKNIERVKTLLGSDFAANKVADTELLDALLGSDVFPQIGALGIGARGLDTPAEREFLRDVMTGTLKMNRGTLIKMTEIRRDVQEESIKQYNERLERGELDRYFEITRRQKKPISLTEEQERRIQRRREGIDTSQERRAARPGAPTRSPTAAPATPGMKSTDDILRELGVLR